MPAFTKLAVRTNFLEPDFSDLPDLTDLMDLEDFREPESDFDPESDRFALSLCELLFFFELMMLWLLFLILFGGKLLVMAVEVIFLLRNAGGFIKSC